MVLFSVPSFSGEALFLKLPCENPRELQTGWHCLVEEKKKPVVLV